VYQTVAKNNQFFWTNDTVIIWRNIRYAVFNHNYTNAATEGESCIPKYTVACKGSQIESLAKPNSS
jgi:hypothetical protein